MQRIPHDFEAFWKRKLESADLPEFYMKSYIKELCRDAFKEGSRLNTIKFKLLSKTKQPLNIFIDECAKDAFMKLMGWSHLDFIENTIIFRDYGEESEIIPD